LVRIDDRLIHGQVATTWLKDYDIEQVLIVDDEVANNELKKNMALIAAPTGIKIHIFGVNKFLEVMNKTNITRKTLLLLTNPFDLKKIIDSGIEIDTVYIGGMRASEERTRISKAVHISNLEKQAFIDLKNVNLIVQTVPRDEKNDLITLINNKE
ncbi:PTS sugar transporter subunit IIB, partial [Enterococcus faecalis]|nr:PTS sugar transporter subunit IIB [Enterococcus faecalis]